MFKHNLFLLSLMLVSVVAAGGRGQSRRKKAATKKALTTWVAQETEEVLAIEPVNSVELVEVEELATAAPAMDHELMNTQFLVKTAAQTGDTRVIANLARMNKNIDVACFDGLTPLEDAVYKGNDKQVAKYFNPERSKTYNEELGTLIHIAVYGWKHTRDNHLRQCAEVRNDRDMTSDKKLSLLNQAKEAFSQTALAYQNIITCLSAQGVDVNQPDKNGNAPLHLVCSARYLNIAKTLIDNGADLSAQDADGMTPFLLACNSTNEPADLVEALLEKGGAALLQHTDAAKNNAFHYAASRNKHSLILHVLHNAVENRKEHRASCPEVQGLLDAANEAGQTPLMIAGQEKNEFAAQVLADFIQKKNNAANDTVLNRFLSWFSLS